MEETMSNSKSTKWDMIAQAVDGTTYFLRDEAGGLWVWPNASPPRKPNQTDLVMFAAYRKLAIVRKREQEGLGAHSASPASPGNK